jgi:hypothetical protein
VLAEHHAHLKQQVLGHVHRGMRQGSCTRAWEAMLYPVCPGYTSAMGQPTGVLFWQTIYSSRI